MDEDGHYEQPAGRITLAHVGGLHVDVSLPDLAGYLDREEFFWLDICDTSQRVDREVAAAIGVTEKDIKWVERFGQFGRLSISQERIRAVTWLAEKGVGFVEIHLWASPRGILTLWNGKAHLLDSAREMFVDRVAGVSHSPYQAAGILLELFLGLVNEAISDVDDTLHSIRDQIQSNIEAIQPSHLGQRLQILRTSWQQFDRYAVSVRSAVVGIELISGIDAGGIRELNDYADGVDDTRDRLHQRFADGAGLSQVYATALAQRQSDQLNRLTIASIIFLPLNFLVGFFGMDFSWMAHKIDSAYAFVLLGVLLPLVTAAVTISWLKLKNLL